MKNRVTFARAAVLLAIAICCAAWVHPQAARVVGTVTAISGSTVTIKTDAGAEQQVTIASDATLKRLEPGQKDLNAAPAIQLSDLAIGDRVLMRLDATASTPTASLVVAMKQSDVAQVHQKDNEAWQRGVAGLVKNVEASSGKITVGTGAGPTAKTVTVKTTSATKVLRYAPGSVRFADAQPGAIDAIKPGDQLRARGTKNADSSEIAADEIVSGTFRNVAGIISSVDASASTLTVKDLTTKKPVTIHVAADVQMRRIPDQVAQMLAARLKGSSNGAGGARSGGAAAGANAPGGAPSGGAGRWSGGQSGNNGGDPQRFLSMAPAIKLTDLQKGQAVMVVATDGATDVNAITLLAGVEPLLEAPAASDLLSNWSMSGGAGGEGGAGTP
ncbi:MAG TPA: hypothetical protein VGJ21_02185 [Terracidiphilus sp.]|jgi:hypothetical protein